MRAYGYHSFREIEVNEIDWQRWQRLVNTVAEMFNAPAAFINQANTKGIEVLIASELPTTLYGPGEVSDIDSNVYSHYVVQRNEQLYVPDASLDQRWRDNPEYRDDNYISYLGMPINWPDGSPFGTLCVMSDVATDYPKTYLKVLEVIREVINADIGHMYRENQLLTASYVDPLTGIYNRRGFEEMYCQNQHLARRLGRQMVLLSFDLDNFKPINDKLGHEAGDAVLRHFAGSLKRSCRNCDLVARWGGDEFLVLAHSETDDLENSLLLRLDTMLGAAGALPEIGYSVGMLKIDGADALSLKELLPSVDERMYHHKRSKKSP
ncbi:sensor domain-containing diguanylate cyclase [Shewanella sp. JM162201]|uniref:Sensor domain-containing diguanylate cyclase n=1 Tax=Shewanella jiangmenensis TaxID=2837387 RepID=A0ABS5UYL8_9GAMM|nr:sensor domain-containing diguanylate cyclase [Shewanella jiangmenensis]MBT1443223.1 sensor domain-containing diguanylate cyclase [Shewanella jiangmenensis]